MCWGCDPSTKRVAIGAVSDGELTTAIKAFSRCPPGARMATIYAETYELARGLRDSGWEPAGVWLERPGGKNIHPSSWQALGCIEAALYAATGVSVVQVPVSSWKAASVGHGGATKEQVLRWAQARGYRGRIEDESDALGVAVYGQVQTAL